MPKENLIRKHCSVTHKTYSHLLLPCIKHRFIKRCIYRARTLFYFLVEVSVFLLNLESCYIGSSKYLHLEYDKSCPSNQKIKVRLSINYVGVSKSI